MSNFEKLYEKTLQGLEEALGVPQNIVEEARRVYQEFLELIDSGDELKTLKDFNLAIGSKIFKDIKISLKTIPDKELTLKSFSVPIYHFFDVSIRKIKFGQDIFEINCAINTPVDFLQKDLKEIFVSKKLLIIPLIAHELHHILVFSSKKTAEPFEMVRDITISNYASGTLQKTNILPIDGFLSSLYLLSAMEILVYPSELAVKIEQYNIRKGNFLEFLESNDVYKILNSMSRFSYEDFLENLKRYEKSIDAFLGSAKGSIDQKIKKCFEIVVKNFFEDIENNLVEYIVKGLDYASKIGSLPSNEVIKKFNQVNDKKLTKYIGREERFFKDSINNFQERASVTKRKLAKLFDLCKENYITNEELLGAPKRKLNEIFEKVQNYNKLADEVKKRYE
jgi:hypothetical protein